MPSHTFALGKGLTEPCPPFRTAAVFGAELNTPNASGWNCAPNLVSPTTSFDLSAISKNREVVVALLVVNFTNQGLYTGRFRWYRERDNKLLYEGSFSYVAMAGGWYYAYSYIGWVDWELSENGTHRVEVELSGADSYSAVKYFTISGIPPAVQPPPPAPVSAAGIVEALSDVSAFCYSLYLTTLGWVWPFWYVAEPFYGLSTVFSTLAGASSDFIALVNGIVAQVANVLSWDTIWSYIVSRIPNLEALRDWFYGWWTNVSSVVTSWWSAQGVTVHGWIDAAVQPFTALRADWDMFWTFLWPQLTRSFDSLKSEWGNFWQLTLPGLVSQVDLRSWWQSRLSDVEALLDSAFSARAGLWSGWQEMRENVVKFFGDPVEYIWSRFVDWFLGPEG